MSKKIIKLIIMLSLILQVVLFVSYKNEKEKKVVLKIDEKEKITTMQDERISENLMFNDDKKLYDKDEYKFEDIRTINEEKKESKDDNIMNNENVTESLNLDKGKQSESKEISYKNVEFEGKTYYYNDITIRNSSYKVESEELSRIKSLIDNYSKKSTFFVFNIKDNMLLTRNATEYMFAASTIKLPYTYYCMTKIDDGTYSLDKKIKYESYHKLAGSGVLQHRTPGKEYTIRELLHYIIHYSDNTAYYMLFSNLNLEGYKNFMKERGFYTGVYRGMPWDNTSAYVLGKTLQDVYYKYINDEKGNWKLYVDELKNSLDSPLKNNLGKKYQIASKSGWARYSYHESGIVFAENPYIVVIMTKSDGEWIDQNYMSNLILAIDDFIVQYNQKIQ